MMSGVPSKNEAIKATAINSISEILKDSDRSDCFQRLLDVKSCSSKAALEEDDLSQAGFVQQFLLFLQEKARSLEITTKCPRFELEVPHSADNVEPSSPGPSQTPESKDDYATNFPSLGEQSSGKSSKSRRRITPTQLPREGFYSNSMSSSFSNSTEGKYAQIFSSKKSKNRSKEPHKIYNIDKGGCIKYQFSSIPPSKKTALDNAISIYNMILENYLVPNITGQFKFLLNILDFLCDNEGTYSHEEALQAECHEILSTPIEWKYFCTKVFLVQKKFLMYLDYTIRKFIALKLSHYSEGGKNIDEFISTLLENRNNSSINFDDTINFRTLKIQDLTESDFVNYDDYTSFCKVRQRFLEEEKNWSEHSSDEELTKSLEFLNKFSGSVTIMFQFGELFAQSLMLSVQESAMNKANTEQKITQLSSRLIKPLSTEPDTEHSFTTNEYFYKNVLDFCFLHQIELITFIRYSVFNKIIELSHEPQEEIGESPPKDVIMSILLDLKIKISLAKFLGYIDFYNRKVYKDIGDREKALLIKVRSQALPYLDIKHFLNKAIKISSLTVTVPWIVQYMCMADHITAYCGYYNDVIMTLISFSLAAKNSFYKDDSPKYYGKSAIKNDYMLKLSIIPPRIYSDKDDDSGYSEGITILIKESSAMFLSLWIGKLFESKTFGETTFFHFFEKYLKKLAFLKLRGGLTWKRCIDSTDLMDYDAYLLLCGHFSKMKYWESNISFNIKNIRPVQLEPSEEKSIDVYAQIEEHFLKEYQDINSLINFVVTRVSNIFQNEFSSLLEKDATSVPANDDQLADKIQEIVMVCEKKICKSMKHLLPPNLSQNIYDTSIIISHKKLKKVIDELLIRKGLHDVDISNVPKIENLRFKSKKERTASMESGSSNVHSSTQRLVQEPLSEAFGKLNALARQLASGEDVGGQNATEALGLFNKISELLQETEDTKLGQELYILSWNYVLHLIISEPQLVSSEFLREMCIFWSINHHGDNEHRILCPRVISPSATKEKNKQQMIAKNIAKLINYCLECNLLSTDNVDSQCVGMLQDTWSKRELDFITLLTTSVSDAINRPQKTADMDYNSLILTLGFLADNARETRHLEDIIS